VIGYATVSASRVAEIGAQPAIWPDREQHQLSTGAFKLSVNKSPGLFLWKVTAGNREHLFARRRLVGLDDSAFDCHVLVRDFRMLHTQAHYAGFLDQARFTRLAAASSSKEGKRAARLVAVPERYRKRWPAIVTRNAENANTRFGQECLALAISHAWLGHGETPL
jgi:hypothetical protein